MKIQPSERLSYALMNHEDADLFFELDQDPEVMRYINSGEITTREMLNNVLIPRMESYRNETEGWGIWKVLITESQQFIGWILVRPMNFFNKPEFDNLELGWRFFRKQWGKGYGTEAAKSIKKAIIDKGKANKISAIAVEENTASINIMKNLGMKYLKTGIHNDPLGAFEVVFYELTIS